MMKAGMKAAFVAVFGFGASLLAVKSCNEYYNSRSLITPAYRMESFTTGVSGHIEYIRYADHSQDVIIYPEFGLRFSDSELHQDLNGDGKVDRMRRNSGEWKRHSLVEMLIRTTDYEEHQHRFGEADALLQRLMQSYPSNAQSFTPTLQ